MPHHYPEQHSFHSSIESFKFYQSNYSECLEEILCQEGEPLSRRYKLKPICVKCRPVKLKTCFQMNQ